LQVRNHRQNAERQQVAESQDRKKQKHAEKARTAQAKGGADDRRSSHRVRDDQQSGHGSMSALSKLKMLERKRAPLRALRDDIV
jgi:hypothetical protein